MSQYDQRSRDELIAEIETLKRERSLILMTQGVALRESEDRFRRMIETANEGIWVLDAKGVTSFVNARMGVLLGYHPDEMVGRHLFDFMDDEAKQVAEEMLARRKKGIKEQFDFRFRSKEGLPVWTLLSTNPIYDQENRYAGSLAMLTDITDRKRAEDALRESEARYRAMVAAFNGFSYICSADYRLEFVNEKLQEELGRDATGELCHDVLHGLSEVCSWCVRDRVLAGDCLQWEVRNPKDGRWFQVSNCPIYNSDGTVSKHGLMTDITQWKRTEADLAKRECILRLVPALCHFGVWEWQAGNGMVTLSDELLRIPGIETAQMSLEQSLGMTHPEDRPKLEQAVQEALVSDTLDLAYRIVARHDGAVRTLRVLGAVIRDADRKPVAMCGIAKDITAH